MRTRLRVFLAVSVLGAGLWGICASDVSAQEDTQSASVTATEDSAATPASGAAQEDWKQEVSSDKAEIQGQREAMKANAQAAWAEEQALLNQIRQAEQSGDYATANSLREQFRGTRQENVQQKQQDMQALQETRKELKSDKREARFDKMDRNNDGVVDDVEKRAFVPRYGDRDNNPPGPKGGPGTNWENRPGPKGGPGAGPDRSITPKAGGAPRDGGAPKAGGAQRGGGKK